MKTTTKRLVLAAALLVPATAAAQGPAMAGNESPKWHVTSFVGSPTAGGSAAKSGAWTVGATAGWRASSRWGAEFDIADTSEFFEQDAFRVDRRVTTVMGTFLGHLPMGGGLSAYGAGGIGLMSVRLAEAGNLARVETDQPAFNVGGGIGWMRNRVGVRGDVRYLRAIGDEADDVNAFGVDVSSLDFVRVSVGLVVGF
jgi:hypothetical protein